MLHQVGVGALGPVFRTYEPTRDRLVAVKVFRLDVTPEQAQSLADELSVAADAGLFHPSVVEPLAAGVEGTVAYRAEEYVAAETLDVALRHYAPAPIDKVLPLITQLAGAVDFARTAGVGHGALHPRDIFVTPEEARATGFGVVEALERLGLRAPVRRPYSAPERVSGGTWGTPADVFSLAAIAYELLTGRRPAGTGSQVGTVSGTSAGHHPAALHAVFVRAMDEDPARRYQTALGFASALDAATRGALPMGTSENGASVVAAAAAGAVVAPLPASAAPVVPLPESVAEVELGDEVDRFQEAEGNVHAEKAVDADASAEILADEAHVTLLQDEVNQLHAEVTRLREEEDGNGEMHAERSLFDAEPLEGLALDAPATFEPDRFADEFSVASADLVRPGRDAGPIEAAAHDRHPARRQSRSAGMLFGQMDDDDRPAPAYEPPASGDAVVHDRPRTAVMPIVLALVAGLLLGAMAYAWFMRGPTDAAPEGKEIATQQTPAAQPPPAPAQPYSEGSVNPSRPQPGQPAQSDPPVVTETPSSAAPPAAQATSTPQPEAAVKSGRVVVRSAPRGASVTINGQWRGRTPLTLNRVPFGSLEVRVVQRGYVTQTERVRLSSGTPSRTLTFKLQRTAPAATPRTAAPRADTSQPQSFTGSIYVDSRPRGARVLIDGQDVGTTPMRVPDVSIGSRVIKLQLLDHLDWTSSTRVVSGQESRVTGSLERIR